MLITGYENMETNSDEESKRLFNALFTRRDSSDTDFSVAVERGEPGCWFPDHAHDMEQIFYVIEGNMEVTIDGEPAVVGPRGLVLRPAEREARGKKRRRRPSGIHRYRSLAAGQRRPTRTLVCTVQD